VVGLLGLPPLNLYQSSFLSGFHSMLSFAVSGLALSGLVPVALGSLLPGSCAHEGEPSEKQGDEATRRAAPRRHHHRRDVMPPTHTPRHNRYEINGFGPKENDVGSSHGRATKRAPRWAHLRHRYPFYEASVLLFVRCRQDGFRGCSEKLAGSKYPPPTAISRQACAWNACTRVSGTGLSSSPTATGCALAGLIRAQLIRPPAWARRQRIASG